MVKNFDDLKIFIEKNMTEELSNAIENNQENVICLDDEEKVASSSEISE